MKKKSEVTQEGSANPLKMAKTPVFRGFPDSSGVTPGFFFFHFSIRHTYKDLKIIFKFFQRPFTKIL